MPKIYRPDTDSQRTQALQSAKAKYDATDPADRAYSDETYVKLEVVLPEYLANLQKRGMALSAQASAGEKANPTRRSTRLFISHFIMSFNMGVLREEFKGADRAYYQLDVSSDSVPKLTTDDDLVQWANNISAGETARTAAGGTPMANPDAVQVEAQLATLNPLLAALSTRKDAYDNAQQQVEDLRTTADDVIADVWDEVLFTYRKDEAPSMRRRAREYGVVYKPSKGEDPSADEFSLKGIVTEKDSGLPLADVHVELVQLTQITTTDAEGRYIFGLQPAGSYTVRYGKVGYQSIELPVTITDGSVTTTDVQLEVNV